MPYYPMTLRQRATRPKEAPRSYAKGKLYGTRWQKYRRWYLSKHPCCTVCQTEGEVVAASEVDHIIPHRGDYHAFWCGEDGLQPMCNFHHNQKTARGD